MDIQNTQIWNFKIHYRISSQDRLKDSKRNRNKDRKSDKKKDKKKKTKDNAGYGLKSNKNGKNHILKILFRGETPKSLKNLVAMRSTIF